MTRCVFLILFFLSIESLSATAAQIEYTTRPACAFKLEGQIVADDFQALRNIVTSKLPFDEFDERTSSICLSSLGGSFAGGLKIAEFIFSQGMSTVIEYGESCFSACAIVFMAGVMPERSAPYRKLSVGGMLGFHAPYLSTPDRIYSKSEIEEAARGMASAIAALVSFAAKDIKMGGELLKKSLIQRLLEKGKDDVFFIKTVFDAARWDIALFDAGRHFDIQRAKISGVVNMCNNFLYSNLDKNISSENLSVEIENFQSKYFPKDYRIMVRNSRTKDLVCEFYPGEDKMGHVIIKGCSYDYWSSRAFGDCRDFKNRPKFLVGKYIPDFYALDPAALLKRFQN